MFTIRKYKLNDYIMLSRWWLKANEPGPYPSMLPEESTFIAYIGDVPALSASLILTNIKGYCYAENFIGNPEITGANRKELGNFLLDYLEEFARSKGYNRLLCMAHKPSLVTRYEELGFKPTLTGITTLIKEIQ